MPSLSLMRILFDSCTGILSFMLSDEITTGSVSSTDQYKRTMAAQSHAWNIKQRKFVEAFPDVSEQSPCVSLEFC